MRRRPRRVAPPLDFRRHRVDVEQIVDDEHRDKDEREDDRNRPSTKPNPCSRKIFSTRDWGVWRTFGVGIFAF